VPLFDRYIAVDWSANNKPKRGKDSIWSCLGRGATADLESKNHSTRHAAEGWLLDQLTAAVRAGERVLVGLDFPYGYPAGFAGALGLDGQAWKEVWTYLACHITDDERNGSNRFEVASDINRKLGRNAPFWGRPAHLRVPNLSSRKEVSYFGAPAPGGLSEWRRVEDQLRSLGRYPQPVWKLFYRGSVGSQTLVGIPVLHRLRNHDKLRRVSHVWPFEVLVPSLPVGLPAVVHAEIWPSIVPFAHEAGTCPDEQQVHAVVERWRELDHDDHLVECFAAAPDDHRVRREEGWVLGVLCSRTIDTLDSLQGRATAPTRPPAPPRSAPVNSMVPSGDRPPCLCGCGNYPRGRHSRFLPGHDQRIDLATGRRFNAH
jgi:precorrin-8X/cobalt-precorrin-8 methylmutase